MVLKTQLPKLSVVAIFPEPLAEVISSVVSIQAVALRIKGLSAEIPLQMPWSTLSNLSAKQSSQRCVAVFTRTSLCSELSWCPSHCWVPDWQRSEDPEVSLQSQSSQLLGLLPSHFGWVGKGGGGDGRAHEWLSAGAVMIVQGRKTEGKNPRGRILFSFQSSDFFFSMFYLILP